MPYDPNPPAGIQKGQGITVNALFSPDNWQTVFTQPAFYFQDFNYQVFNNQDWLYPTNNFSWRVRFAPNRVGSWQYKLTAQDASGSTQSQTGSFTVTPSANKGFIQVSPKDSRYFQFNDGTYFPGLGINMNFDQISWNDPISGNQANFQKMGQNGIQLVRMWLSQWSIFGSFNGAWRNYDLGSDWDMLSTISVSPGSDFSLSLDSDWQLYGKNGEYACLGWMMRSPAIKPYTKYQISVRYYIPVPLTVNSASQPFGFVVKLGGNDPQNSWLDDPRVASQGFAITNYRTFSGPAGGPAAWDTLSGTWTSGNINFLPMLYLAMVNTNRSGGHQVFIDSVEMREDLGGGQFGPNIITKPSMDQHLYMQQRNSYAFDRVLDLAGQNNVYLKVVGLDKEDYIFNHIDMNGNTVADDDFTTCPENICFYGDGGDMTKVFWLQQAWWRYMQARWGYSTNIQSWELLNEGNPSDSVHYSLANNFGAYMHQFKPNDHLVTTSLWSGFPAADFWANPAYSNIDYADYHQYIPESDPLFLDTALATYNPSMLMGAKQPGGAGKPLIRGETGFTQSGSQPATTQFQADTSAIWLHNFIWGQINPGGMLESYWYANSHIYLKNSNGSYAFDFRDHFAEFYNFIKDVPLNNGQYVDAAASVSNNNLRVWGQKDLTHGLAHLWIANKAHTWKNVVNGVTIPVESGTVKLSGFQVGATYTVQWWDTYQTNLAQAIIRTDRLFAQSDGTITLMINSLTTDIAVKITPYRDLQNAVYIPIVSKP